MAINLWLPPSAQWWRWWNIPTSPNNYDLVLQLRSEQEPTGSVSNQGNETNTCRNLESCKLKLTSNLFTPWDALAFAKHLLHTMCNNWADCLRYALVKAVMEASLRSFCCTNWTGRMRMLNITEIVSELTPPEELVHGYQGWVYRRLLDGWFESQQVLALSSPLSLSLSLPAWAGFFEK